MILVSAYIVIRDIVTKIDLIFFEKMTTIDEPLICSIVCSYLKPYELQQVQTVSRAFYESTQILLRKCTVVSTSGLYTVGSRYYLPYLDIPLSEKILIDSHDKSFYLRDADDQLGYTTMITNGSILVPFKDEPMFLFKGILRASPKNRSDNGNHLYDTYDRGILDSDDYAFCKEWISLGYCNHQYEFLCHHMHRHERDHRSSLVTDTFEYAIIDNGNNYRDFEDIFDANIGFSIEEHDHDGTHRLEPLDSSSCTIQEYLDTIDIIYEPLDDRHGLWTIIDTIEFTKDNGIHINMTLMAHSF